MNTAETVIHPEHGEGVVDWVDDEDGEARVKYDGVTAWTTFDGLKRGSSCTTKEES